jgi:RNA polymerase sigma-70 factor, ECF subfamily
MVAVMNKVLQQIEQEIPRLRRYARYLCRDVDQADDLVQECLLRSIAKIESWQPGTNLRAWLFVILRNAYISEVRRSTRMPFSPSSPEDDLRLVVSGGQEASVALFEVRAALDALSVEHREVVHLVAVEGLKYEEAAEVLDVPTGTVRSRLSRARLALRERLESARAPAPAFLSRRARVAA